MLAFLAYFLLPLVWLFIASTKSIGDLFGPFGLWFAHDFHLLQNVRELFATRTLDGGTYLVWILNSALYSVTSAIAAALLATAAAYRFAKFSFLGRDAIFCFRGAARLFWSVVPSVLVPTTATAVPLFLLCRNPGRTNSRLSNTLQAALRPCALSLVRTCARAAPPS